MPEKDNPALHAWTHYVIHTQINIWYIRPYLALLAFSKASSRWCYITDHLVVIIILYSLIGTSDFSSALFPCHWDLQHCHHFKMAKPFTIWHDGPISALPKTFHGIILMMPHYRLEPIVMHLDLLSDTLDFPSALLRCQPPFPHHLLSHPGIIPITRVTWPWTDVNTFLSALTPFPTLLQCRHPVPWCSWLCHRLVPNIDTDQHPLHIEPDLS